MENREASSPIQSTQVLPKKLVSENTPEPTQSPGVISSMTKWIDRNGRYIQWGFYGVGVVGIYIIGRSIRLGTRFADAKLIPREFYYLNVSLFGHVHKVQTVVKPFKPGEHTQVFTLQHEPIMLPFRRPYRLKNPKLDQPNNNLLRIVVPALNIHEQNVPDVERYLQNKIVKFTLIRYEDKYKAAMCTLHTKGFFTYKSVGKWCVRNGYASVGSVDNDDLQCVPSGKYYNEICREEYKVKEKTPYFRRLYNLLKLCLQQNKKY